jgi:acyl carrier protein phosphodiesterase
VAAEKCIAVMNYLAHAYLSFMHEEILVGNLISDFVKGKKKFDYSIGIQHGIALHRSIDVFTDNHPATKEAKKPFKEAVGLYAGAFVDVVYDHFLAINKVHWSVGSLEQFSQEVYNTLDSNYRHLPEGLQRMLPYMKDQDWLANYQYQWGIEKSFGGVARRAIYLDDSIAAFEAFMDNYEALQQLADVFIADVKKYAAGELQLLLNG